MMGHPSSGLDDIALQKTRLGILASLSEAGAVEFRFLQETLGATAGNLSRHLSILADAGLVEVKKGYSGKGPVACLDQGSKDGVQTHQRPQ